MSATLGDTTFFEEELTKLNGRPTAAVQSNDRPVPLEHAYSELPLATTLESLVADRKAPVYVVHFTQLEAAQSAQDFTSINVCTREEKAEIGNAIEGFKFSSPYGPEIRKWLKHGIGLHHAGLLPYHKEMVEELFQRGRPSAASNVPETSADLLHKFRIGPYLDRLPPTLEFVGAHQYGCRLSVAGDGHLFVTGGHVINQLAQLCLCLRQWYRFHRFLLVRILTNIIAAQDRGQAESLFSCKVPPPTPKVRFDRRHKFAAGVNGVSVWWSRSEFLIWVCRVKPGCRVERDGFGAREKAAIPVQANDFGSWWDAEASL